MDFSQWFQDFLQSAVDFIPHLILGLIVFAASLYLSVPASRWAGRAAEKRLDDPSLVNLIRKLTRWAVIITGTIAALEQVNFNVTGFVAGLGIAGLTIGFALQDITRNFIAGIILMTRKPFEIGDTVEISGYTGKVININTRDTMLKTFDGEVVILPNMNVFNTAIVNVTNSPHRRRTLRIGLGYEEDMERAERIFYTAIVGVEGVEVEPAASVLAETLGDSTVSLVARFWVDQRSHDHLVVHSNVVRAIKEAAERENIDLPYPIQTMRIEERKLPATKASTG